MTPELVFGDQGQAEQLSVLYVSVPSALKQCALSGHAQVVI